MPVTQRWVHSGLLLVAVIFSVSMTVLILGASRPVVNNAGLPGSPAPMFTLRDRNGNWVKLHEWSGKTVVLLIASSQSANFEKQAKQVGGLIDSYGNDGDIQFAAIEFDPGSSMLNNARTDTGAVETWLPALQIMRDVDASVAQAYRVGSTPMLFIIDGNGMIRSRVALEGNGSTIAASEMLSSFSRSSIPLPSMATDHKMY